MAAVCSDVCFCWINYVWWHFILGISCVVFMCSLLQTQWLVLSVLYSKFFIYKFWINQSDPGSDPSRSLFNSFVIIKQITIFDKKIQWQNVVYLATLFIHFSYWLAFGTAVSNIIQFLKSLFKPTSFCKTTNS